MIPIVTVAEMAEIDERAPEGVEVLIQRAGAAVARRAARELGGLYGRRIAVVAGKGNNGNDGRVAAALLTARGARCRVLAPGEVIPTRWWHEVSLVIDAAFGTGYRPRDSSPLGEVPHAPILAVDIPSGVHGDTGEAAVGVWRAATTVTFGALKPGLVLAQGRELAGRVTVADIGLDVQTASARLVQADDVLRWRPIPRVDGHKWRSAVWVIAGSAGMTGAASLAARAAQRGGAGYVRLSTPGAAGFEGPAETVGFGLVALGWSDQVLAGIDRFAALVIGPGLGRSDTTTGEVRRVLAEAAVPMVVDADALFALTDMPRVRWPAARILTPHDGEFARLTGASPEADRFAATRRLAAQRDAVVLLKGPTTIVAAPNGEALAVMEGPPTLATAGTGDVLAGLIGALLAQGVTPMRAAATAAFLHGRAARLGRPVGLVAGDLAELLAAAWQSVGFESPLYLP